MGRKVIEILIEWRIVFLGFALGLQLAHIEIGWDITILLCIIIYGIFDFIYDLNVGGKWLELK